MNLRTADRLRFAARILHLGLTLATLWIAVASGLRVQQSHRRLDKVEDIDRKQIKALYTIADAVDGLYRLQPGPNTPQLPPLPELPPEPQTNSFLKLNLREGQTPMSRNTRGVPILRLTMPTKDSVQRYRKTGEIPPILTKRFVALLKKSELAALEERMTILLENRHLPKTNGAQVRRLRLARLATIQKERRTRGLKT